MRFTLTYDGKLRADGRPKHKWEIRQHISPQLKELWKVSPALQYLRKNKLVPLVPGFIIPVVHHTVDLTNDSERAAREGWLDVCGTIKVKGRSFLPLIRDSLALHCGLKILFLRKEEPGRLIQQGGDLDNRLKTLFDALSMPNEDQIIGDSAGEEPIHCLMENDRLVSGCSIETQRLLSKNASKNDVRLVIEVDVRVTQSRAYNQPLLGD
jgi:hypothetical protein